MAEQNSKTDMLDDSRIVELYFLRSEEAIKQTDKKYGSYLLAVAYNILHNRQDGEECLNDTYIGAWNSIPPTRPKILRVFLTAIMRKTALECYRMKNRKKRIPSDMICSLSELDDVITNENDPQEAYNIKELGECINAYVHSLSERRMYVFVARYYFFRSLEDIAEALSVSKSTVSKEIAAIKVGLRQKLESEGYVI